MPHSPFLSKKLNLGDGDRRCGADVQTGLTVDALAGLIRVGLAIGHLEDHLRAVVHTLLASGTCVVINRNQKQNIHLLL